MTLQGGQRPINPVTSSPYSITQSWHIRKRIIQHCLAYHYGTRMGGQWFLMGTRRVLGQQPEHAGNRRLLDQVRRWARLPLLVSHLTVAPGPRQGPRVSSD